MIRGLRELAAYWDEDTEESRKIIEAIAEIERLTDELMKANDNIRGFADSEREITSEVERLRTELKGDGLLTLPDQVDHARDEIQRMKQLYEDITSIALWSTRRLPKIHKDFAYDAIEANLGEGVERV